MTHVQLENVSASNHEKRIRNFAEHFVDTIIEEAVKKSSILCQHLRGTQFHPIDAKNLVRSTSRNFMPSCVGASNRNNDANSTFLRKKNFVSEDLYTLPVDIVRRVKSKKSTLEHQCLKPKAIRAFNVIKSSSHTRNLCDLKYILLRLYSSNGVSSKKIGSEHSAFTKYQCRSRSNKRLDSTQLESKRGSRSEQPRAAGVMKTGGSDLRRWKRCNFFDLKNSVCGVFKSHKKLAEDSTLDESSFKSFKDRSLPPLPGSYENFDNSAAGNSGKKFDDANAYDADVEFSYGNYAAGCVKKGRAFDFASSIEKVKDVSSKRLGSSNLSSIIPSSRRFPNSSGELGLIVIDLSPCD